MVSYFNLCCLKWIRIFVLAPAGFSLTPLHSFGSASSAQWLQVLVAELSY